MPPPSKCNNTSSQDPFAEFINDPYASGYTIDQYTTYSPPVTAPLRTIQPPPTTLLNSFPRWNPAHDNLLYNLATSAADDPMGNVARRFPAFSLPELCAILVEAQVRIQHRSRALPQPPPKSTPQPKPKDKQPAARKPAMSSQPGFEDLLEMYDEGIQIRKERGITEKNAPDWTKRRG